MSHFISYSRRDTEFVDLLQRLLMSKGYDIWIDRRGISAGQAWDKAIEVAIKSCETVLVVLSPEATESQNVGDEWNLAMEENKRIIPVYYRECETPMRLRRLQWIDFRTLSFESAFKQLIGALGQPDFRPDDPLELARREGFVLVEVQLPLDLEKTRIAFVYSDYPFVKAFLGKVWFTLLWRLVDRYTYGEQWVLRDKQTGQHLIPGEAENTERLLLHDLNIEPGSQLEVLLLKGSS
jgi:hypothetical protein